MDTLSSGNLNPTQNLTGQDTSNGIDGGIPQEFRALIGAHLNGERFEVQELLGRGGQGAVFRVLRRDRTDIFATSSVAAAPESPHFVPRPLRTPNEAALKVFFPNSKFPSLTERLIAEYRIAARFKEGPFVRAYEMFEDKGKLCYTMDLMVGGSLAQFLGTPLPVALAVGITLDVLEGLDRLHGSGIVHRDIKHHNISSVEIQVADFPKSSEIAGKWSKAAGLYSS